MKDHYIAGFVDGEGSFHVAFQRNPDVRLGWQAIPEFHVSQHVSSRSVLEAIRERLGCGIIKANHRGSRKDRTQVLVVRNRHDLAMKVVPFFDRYSLYTEKRNDFRRFKLVVEMMVLGAHRSTEGLAKIVEIAYAMNAGGNRRRVAREMILRTLRSSETIRQRSARPVRPDSIKI